MAVSSSSGMPEIPEYWMEIGEEGSIGVGISGENGGAGGKGIW